MRVSVALALCCLGSLSFAADPAHASIRKTTDIPAEELGSALQTLAKDYDFQVLYRTEIVKDLRTQGAVGTLTSDEALGKVLKGTGLSYKYLDANTVTVFATSAPSATAAAADPSQTTQKNAKEGQNNSNSFRVAQVDQGKSSKASSVGNQASSTQENSKTPSAGLEEIVVTAQKKSESIQNVPLSVATISSETFAKYNYNKLSDYASTIPGLQVDSGGAPGFNTITIRGVTTGNLYGSTLAAVTIDDVPASGNGLYAASYGSIDLIPYDIDRVEVLKGPQGTLYGASSMGGLLKYVLTTPDLMENSLKVGSDAFSIDHGSGAGYGFRGSGNIVLVPGELALNASGAHTYTPGFITNIQNGQTGLNHGTQDQGRLALHWQPIEDLSINLSTLFNESKFNSTASIPLTVAGQPLFGPLDVKYYFPSNNEVRTTLSSADISYNVGWATLSSITGYSDWKTMVVGDASQGAFFKDVLGVLVPSGDLITLKKFSQELRLASPQNQSFQWMLGGFYTHENGGFVETAGALDPTTRLPTALNPLENIVAPSTYKETAAFGNVTYQITQQWDISAGLRYSHNAESAYRYGGGPGGIAGLFFNSLTTPYRTPVYDSSESVTTYSASSRYRLTPDAMIYVRVANGYRPGGANIDVAGAPLTYGSDKLTNYELGVKSELLNRRLLLNVAVFDIQWSGIQLGQYTATHLLYTGNAGSAISRGVEATSQFALTPEIRLGLNAVYNNAKLTADAPAVNGADGDRLPLSAQWSGSVTGDWNHPINNTYALQAGVIWRYVGDRDTDFPGGGGIPGGSNFLHLASYNTVDLSFGIRINSWTVNAFAKNLNNATSYLRYYAPDATVMQPRTVGVSLDVAF